MTSILLIEDDPIRGESLMQRFELEGLPVRGCRRLREARAPLLPLPPAVVSDVRLPDGLATECFVALPATVRALPWFFLTGYGSVNDAVAAVQMEGERYSSTSARTALAAGDMGKAAAILSRPWAIEGVVQRGFQRGRDFGFATANVPLGE